MAFPARAADGLSARAEARALTLTGGGLGRRGLRPRSRRARSSSWRARGSDASLTPRAPQARCARTSRRAAVRFAGRGPFASWRGTRSSSRSGMTWCSWSPPQEWSLSSLAPGRPLVAPYDPTWDRALARHFAPLGSSPASSPSPAARATEVARSTTSPPCATRSPPPSTPTWMLRALTAMLLRSRASRSPRPVSATSSAAPGRPPPVLSPRPRAVEIVRRMTATRGAIDVKD